MDNHAANKRMIANDRLWDDQKVPICCQRRLWPANNIEYNDDAITECFGCKKDRLRWARYPSFQNRTTTFDRSGYGLCCKVNNNDQDDLGDCGYNQAVAGPCPREVGGRIYDEFDDRARANRAVDFGGRNGFSRRLSQSFGNKSYRGQQPQPTAECAGYCKSCCDENDRKKSYGTREHPGRLMPCMSAPISTYSAVHGALGRKIMRGQVVLKQNCDVPHKCRACDIHFNEIGHPYRR